MKNDGLLLKEFRNRTSLVIQQLRLSAFTVAGADSIPSQGIKDLTKNMEIGWSKEGR